MILKKHLSQSTNSASGSPSARTHLIVYPAKTDCRFRREESDCQPCISRMEFVDAGGLDGLWTELY